MSTLQQSIDFCNAWERVTISHSISDRAKLQVATGRLLKAWAAHDKCLKCMIFSDDGSILISSSDDGMLCMWSMISLLDMEDSGSLPSLLHCSLEHTSSITGLVTMSACASSTFVSSSLDGTCKVWDQISGMPIKTQVYPVAITAIVLHPAEQVLFSGSIDGSIFVGELDIGPVEDPFSVTENQSIVLKGHKGSVIAMSFSKSGLISASTDCTVCLWDVNNWVIIRRFNHQKGAITNTVVIPRSALLNHQRSSSQYCISLLEKYPQRPNSANETVIFLPSSSSLKGNHASTGLQKTSLLDQHIFESKQEHTRVAMQVKVETCVEQRTWATNMAKHVMGMNKHLQCRLLDLMCLRFLWLDNIDSVSSTKQRKKFKVQTPSVRDQQS